MHRPFDSRLPTCRVWKGNLLPHPNRHTADRPSFLAPRRVPFGWITACDLCGFARHDPFTATPDDVEARRVEHLRTAHHTALMLGQATIHTTDHRRPA